MKERIGLATYGPIGSGKTFTAQAVKEMYGDEVEIFSFANPLKALAEEMLGRKINKATDRLFVAHVGQGIRSDVLKFMGPYFLKEFLFKSTNNDMFPDDREFKQFCDRIDSSVREFTKANPSWGHTNFWVEVLIKQIEESNCRIAIVDDLRFKAEYDALKNVGFDFIKMECPSEIRVARIVARDGKYNPETEQHPSELEWPRFPRSNVLYTYDRNKDISLIDPLTKCEDMVEQLEAIVARTQKKENSKALWIDQFGDSQEPYCD